MFSGVGKRAILDREMCHGRIGAAVASQLMCLALAAMSGRLVAGECEMRDRWIDRNRSPFDIFERPNTPPAKR